MIESDCFEKLNHVCQLNELNIDPTISTTKYIIDVALYAKEKLIQGYQNDPLLQAAFDRFAPTWELHRLQIHELLPNKCYDWHTDSRNGSSLNCAWGEYDSLTFFYNESTSLRDGVLDTITMKYEPKVWYAFNPQIPHSVFNFGDQTRYMVTASFEPTVSYADLVTWYRTTFP